MAETKEIYVNFRVDDVVPEPNRTKLFFIIHQSMIDESLNWEEPVKIINYKEPVDPYSKDQYFMNTTKIHNQLTEHLDKVIKDYNLSNNLDNYFLVKLNGRIEHPLINFGCLVYLPQTNQLFSYYSDWDSRILLSHEYAFIVEPR